MMRAGVVRNDPIGMGVEVAIGYVGPDSATAVIELGFRGARWESCEAHERLPTITIPDDVARALLDALSTHYGGAADTRTLRRDYEDERKRVDKLISYLTKETVNARA